MQKILHSFQIFWNNIEKISQFCLLLLAGFGYIYTVIPVYQKELLNEQIAQKEIELTQKNNDLVKLKSSVSKLQDTLKNNTNIIFDQKKNLQQNAYLLAQQQIKISKSNTQINKLEISAKDFKENADLYYQEYQKKAIDLFAIQWVQNLVDKDLEEFKYLSEFKTVIPSELKSNEKALLIEVLKQLDNETRPTIHDMKAQIENAKIVFLQEKNKCKDDLVNKKMCEYNAYIKYSDTKTAVAEQYYKIINVGIKKISNIFNSK